jgi:ElaB/YqjD/DUF883 family membrane-anchored ribosome-binding protein
MNIFSLYSPTSREAGNGASSLVGAGEFSLSGAQTWLNGGGEKIKKLVSDQPALALGTAFAAGVFLGWLIKRR